MGLPQKYNRIMRREILAYATYLPFAHPFEVGDYGEFNHGIFQYIGNIRDYGVTFGTKPGSDIDLKFQTAGVTEVCIEGGVEVPAFSGSTTIDAELQLSFHATNSIRITAPVIRAEVMEDLTGVADQLLTATHHSSGATWERKYRVVRTVYTAEQPLVLATRQRKNKVVLNAKAGVLQQLQLGKATGAVSISRDYRCEVEIGCDKSGSLGVQLFRVKTGGTPGLESIRGAWPDTDEEWPDELNEGDE